MYLSRFRLNTARPGARRLLSSPQSLHAAVMSSFPNLLPTDSGTSDGPRVLWRLDRNAAAEVLLYVVSPDRPDMTHLVEQAGWPAAATAEAPGWQSRPYTPFLDRLAEGSVWAFRLTANPVHQIRRKPGEPTKRTAHLTTTHQMDWLLDPGRQERGGFLICEKPADKRLLPGGTTHRNRPHHGDRYELMVRDQRNLAFPKKGTGDASKQHQVTLVTVTYDGRLTVTDPDRLRTTLTQGLGKAKAYGCGLMTLVPLSTTAG
ncbi:type I-E CRISPR-associated protein Cas6/Cse3/CasE [Streptomyces sp. PSKA30]|uniref:type I-E CRISPR-associated protein Cas6/Cse3/CasE n=1 Tax=Streptomyces sp. PSKA30 TaxID=2874597 RepID=UPI001CD05A0E|nr:type I-E CRISPR-associated protein Cas6/Cse3/CasE [Streptomyces sp. PSKA30]MBZ9645784.1 type I-E CRISPR-associated protein Cas6/Cse3/CasE [Streptomyces sp. PSKA30]